MTETTVTADEAGIDIPDDWNTHVVESDGLSFDEEDGVTDATAVLIELPEPRHTVLGSSAGTDVTLDATWFMAVDATVEFTDEEKQQMEMLGDEVIDFVQNVSIMHSSEDGIPGEGIYNQEGVTMQDAIDDFFETSEDEAVIGGE